MDINYNGLPSLEGKTVEQSLEILHRHCHQTALIMVKMNQEMEGLKSQVEQLQARIAR